MADLPGICGPANRPCKIAHSSTFSNQIGVYPSDFLPANSTIWHAVFASQFPLSQAEFQVGDFGGLGLGTLDTVGGAISPTLPSFHDFQSHHYVIFAKTANRINIAYTLTQKDIDTANADGIGEIDIGEFVFEFISVTDEPIDANIELTDDEIKKLKENPECTIGCSEEAEEDKKFRSLFELNINNNRFINIVFNKLGVEYRLDNGSEKSKTILDQSGLGDLDSASYKDGSSKKINIRIKTFNSDGEELPDSLTEGDVIYLSYLAIKEHYIRQRVVISWKVIDPGTSGGVGSECISLINGFNVAHFRFFEWDIDSEPSSPVTKLAGWRVVETFNAKPNFIAPIDIDNETVLADFIAGEPTTTTSHVFSIMPGRITSSKLEEFITNRDLMPKIQIKLDRSINNEAFHINAGNGTNNTAFKGSNWFIRNQFTKYTNRNDANDHVFFNVHSSALKKRDIDKFGIEKFLAIELEKDINNRELTFFPFMDDPQLDNPSFGNIVSLSSNNTVFMPIQPITSYGGNFEAVCGSIGSFPTNPSDGINSYHSFESNKITERFEKDTHILVERNFAVNATILGPRLITIEGTKGTVGSITCITDPSKEFQFASHINNDHFLVYNFFSSGHTERAIRQLTFSPHIPAPPFKDNKEPNVSQFEELVGFSGMVGDIPGIQPGKTISLASFADIDDFIFKTTEPKILKTKLPSINDTQIEILSMPDSNVSPVVISFNESYCGSLIIEYSLNGNFETKNEQALLLAKSGNNIIGSVDNITIRSTNSIQVNFNWLKASSLELVGERVENMNIKSINLQSIIKSKLNDFLNEHDSHSIDFAKSSISSRLINRSLLFSSDIISISEDERSFLYIFFNDTDGGISVAASNDFAATWVYYYGIVEPINNIEARNPFVVNNFNDNSCFLFFQFKGKILCKNISFSLFNIKDANLIQRFEDIFQPGNEKELPKENTSIYTDRGKILRRSILSYVAAGDLTDNSFLEIIGKVSGENNFEYSPFEMRNVEGKTIKIRKNPIARSPSTAFTNSDVIDMFFSAYRKDNGELRLWFLNFTEQSNDVAMLQCHFSIDNGRSWLDLWEFLENKFNRFRIDKDKNTQFIDKAVSNNSNNIIGIDPQNGSQVAPFGINVHWSRLKRHKINSTKGELTINSESKVLEISSPYVFYQSMTNRVFLFYIYENCLLCKIFNDNILSESRQLSNLHGIKGIKDILERQTRSHFIDGKLTNLDLQEELHGFANTDSKEIMSEGNIIFKYPFAVENFGDDRSISSQRICALDLPTGLVRVFYKQSDSVLLKSALWTGSEWWAEDFLRKPERSINFQFPDESLFSKVTGGFRGTGF